MGEAGAKVEAALVGREVSRHFVHVIAVKIAAHLDGKAGDLAIKSASAGHVKAVGTRREQVYYRVEG